MKIYLILIALPLLGFAEDNTAEICGKILKLQGQVEVLRLKDKADVRIGIKAIDQMPLQCNDMVLTGRSSRAKIKIGTTLLTMSSQSRLSIDEHNATTKEPNIINLMYGKVRSLVKPRPSEDKNLSITTSTAVMGVRGTDLFIGFDPNTRLTHQATLEGKVEVEQKSTGQKVLVEPGQQVKVEAQTPPTESKPIPPTLKAEPISNKVVEEIRQASFIAKEDKEFASAQAVKVLGEPQTWTPPDDELPLDLKGIKNEF